MSNPMMNDEPEQYASAASGRSGPPWSLIALLIVAAISAVFVIQNRDRTTIDFLFFDVESRVWTAIAISIVLGIILDRLILTWWRRARRRKNESA